MPRTPSEARPRCKECGDVLDPTRAQSIHTLKGDEQWIESPDLLRGLYCDADCALDAYLRGWPADASGDRPKFRRGPGGRFA